MKKKLEGKAYSVDLPYLIIEPYNADIHSANKNVDLFGDLIKEFKVYIFSDATGYKRFVLKTQY